jgi:hypothetical protein
VAGAEHRIACRLCKFRHIEKDETVNFNKYKTFTWLHGENGKLENQSDLIESKIRVQ